MTETPAPLCSTFEKAATQPADDLEYTIDDYAESRLYGADESVVNCPEYEKLLNDTKISGIPLRECCEMLRVYYGYNLPNFDEYLKEYFATGGMVKTQCVIYDKIIHRLILHKAYSTANEPSFLTKLAKGLGEVRSLSGAASDEFRKKLAEIEDARGNAKK